MSKFSSADQLKFARRVAEMLAMPHLACSHPKCRRRGRCSFYFPETQKPACLAKLNAAQRAIFEEIQADSEYVASHWDPKLLAQRPASVTKDLRELAIEVVLSLVGKAHRRKYAEWQRNYAAEMAAPANPPAIPPATAPAKAPVAPSHVIAPAVTAPAVKTPPIRPAPVKPAPVTAPPPVQRQPRVPDWSGFEVFDVDVAMSEPKIRVL